MLSLLNTLPHLFSFSHILTIQPHQSNLINQTLSIRPIREPTRRPSMQPSRQPSSQPSSQPNHIPTQQPTRQPSSQPSTQPSSQPSRQPFKPPTSIPSRQPSTNYYFCCYSSFLKCLITTNPNKSHNPSSICLLIHFVIHFLTHLPSPTNLPFSHPILLTASVPTREPTSVVVLQVTIPLVQTITGISAATFGSLSSPASVGFSSAILSALNGAGSTSSSGVSSSVSGVVSRVTTTNDHSHSHDDGSGSGGTTISSDSDNGNTNGKGMGNRLLLGTTTPTASSVGYIKGLGPRAVQVTKIKGGSLTPTYKPTQKPTLNPTGMFRYDGL